MLILICCWVEGWCWGVDNIGGCICSCGKEVWIIGEVWEIEDKGCCWRLYCWIIGILMEVNMGFEFVKLEDGIIGSLVVCFICIIVI